MTSQKALGLKAYIAIQHHLYYDDRAVHTSHIPVFNKLLFGRVRSHRPEQDNKLSEFWPCQYQYQISFLQSDLRSQIFPEIPSVYMFPNEPQLDHYEQGVLVPKGASLGVVVVIHMDRVLWICQGRARVHCSLFSILWLQRHLVEHRN